MIMGDFVVPSICTPSGCAASQICEGMIGAKRSPKARGSPKKQSAIAARLLTSQGFSTLSVSNLAEDLNALF
jgi:hypothetical protein